MERFVHFLGSSAENSTLVPGCEAYKSAYQNGKRGRGAVCMMELGPDSLLCSCKVKTGSTCPAGTKQHILRTKSESVNHATRSNIERKNYIASIVTIWSLRRDTRSWIVTTSNKELESTGMCSTQNYPTTPVTAGAQGCHDSPLCYLI